MDQFIVDAVAAGGYWGIFFLMMLENIIPPIPSEVIMGVAGVLVGRGVLDFWTLLLVGTLGTTAGNYAWFWLGNRYGYERLAPLIDRWGRWLTLDWEHVEQASGFLRKHGHWVVFFLRFSPFLRTMISLPAGLAHMPLGKFLAFTFAGSAVWNALLLKGGEWLGHWLQDSQDVLAWIVIGSVVLCIVAYIWRLISWTPRPRDRSEQGSGADTRERR